MNLTCAELQKYLHYNEKTGLFIRVKKYRKKGTPRVAGYKHSKGYIHLKLNGKNYKAHRLAFLYMTELIPEQVDHDNGIKHDNRWLNLNPANALINTKNTKLYSNNTSGIPGVLLHIDGIRYRSHIRVNKKLIYLGLFDSFLDACCARKSAEHKYNFNTNHGRK